MSTMEKESEIRFLFCASV